MCSAFFHFTPGHLILVPSFGCGKVHFQNNCVQFWVWVNTFLEKLSLLCVVVCGDRRGPANWNVLIMFILGVVHLIFTKPNLKKEKDCLVGGEGAGGKLTFSHVQNKTILELYCSVLGWDQESFTKQRKSKSNKI